LSSRGATSAASLVEKEGRSYLGKTVGATMIPKGGEEKNHRDLGVNGQPHVLKEMRFC